MTDCSHGSTVLQTNYGWVINMTGSTNGWDMDSSESGNKPLLSVTYITPGSQASATHTLTVDTANDVMDGDATSIDALLANKGADGLISLREAIWATNNTTNFDASTPDVINFAIGVGGSSQTIMVNAGGLPTITDAVVLDASTQGGNQLITLDGTNADGCDWWHRICAPTIAPSAASPSSIFRTKASKSMEQQRSATVTSSTTIGSASPPQGPLQATRRRHSHH